MITEQLQTHLRDIIEIARYAPSVHNTQPWLVSQANDSITITIDKRHTLHDGDPTQRETFISLGIFVAAIQLAAAQFKLTVHKTNLQTDQVTLFFSDHSLSENTDESIRLLKRRATDRSIYKPAPISDDFRAALQVSSQHKAVSVWLVTEKNAINKIAELTAKGISVALSSPDFRAELSQYLVLPWSHKRRGIAVKSLYIPWFIAWLEPINIRLGIGLKSEVKLEAKRWQSASGIVCITSEGDMPKDWFETGRAYLTVSLLIEKFGLSQATSAATVEATTFHEDVEALLGTPQRLQSVIRIGTGSRSRRYSPRVSVDDLLSH